MNIIHNTERGMLHNKSEFLGSLKSSYQNTFVYVLWTCQNESSKKCPLHKGSWFEKHVPGPSLNVTGCRFGSRTYHPQGTFSGVIKSYSFHSHIFVRLSFLHRCKSKQYITKCRM